MKTKANVYAWVERIKEGVAAGEFGVYVYATRLLAKGQLGRLLVSLHSVEAEAKREARALTFA